MKHMVFVEGVDGVGKTSLIEALGSWRSDTFSFFDRGPWSRYVYGTYFGFRAGLAPAASLIRRIGPMSIVVHVHRPFEAIERCRAGTERATVEAQERLFEEIWRTLGPRHVVHLHNDDTVSLDDLARTLRERLQELVPEEPDAPAEAVPDESSPAGDTTRADG